MRVVLDSNVLISALLSRDGAPARVLRAWFDGAFDLVASEALLAELERALAYPKLRERVAPADAAALVEVLRRGALLFDDPLEPPSVRSPDPGDDYLIALGEHARAIIVTGDAHLLGLTGTLPVLAPAAFLDELDRRP